MGAAHQYRRDIAECIAEAARRGLIERYARVGGHGRVANLAEPGEALYVIHLITEHPDRYQRRLWEQLSWLQPELGDCVAAQRRLDDVERHVARGEELLAGLREKTSAGSPGREGASAADRRDKWPQPLVT